jgi:hypothetical protein
VQTGASPVVLEGLVLGGGEVEKLVHERPKMALAQLFDFRRGLPLR